MSYIDCFKVRNEVIIWEREASGKRIVRRFKAPYYFYIPDPNGEHTSIYGEKLRKCEYQTKEEFALAKASHSPSILHESDIKPELRILSQEYYGKEPPKLHTSYFDIEVDYEKERGFASIEDPYAPINSVAIYNDWSNRMVLIAVPPTNDWLYQTPDEISQRMNDVASLPSDVDVDVILVSSERELLVLFLKEIEDADIISGWNSRIFDVPYTAARLELLGKRFFKKLTFPEAPTPKWSEIERFGGTSKIVEMIGRTSIDYLDIFKKFEVSERHSFKLEYIADEILPDMPKLEYEGSLADLYQKDFIWFIRYNLRDTEILKGFEERRGYMENANRLVHVSSAQFKDLMGTLKLAELSTIDYCHHELSLIVPNNRKTEEEIEQFAGATVLEPKVGMHDWLSSIDIKSLYPSTIRAINISPETIIGQFDGNVKASEAIGFKHSNDDFTLHYENGDVETKSVNEWRKFLIANKWCISGYGTVFDQNKNGIVPSLLSNWYSLRKEYQRLKKEAAESGDKLKSTYYDKLQYITKIRLNAYYGALGNRYFRFFDLRMAESTTGTGRLILLHQGAKVNECLTGEYDHEGDSVIYGDTDSIYFKTYCDNKRNATLVGDRVSELTTKSFKPFMVDKFLCTDGFCELISANREIVSDRGIFVSKKMYILHIVDNEGYDSDKLKVMGLATKRTTLPKDISNYLNDAIKNFLKNGTWEDLSDTIVKIKSELMDDSVDVRRLGLPKGVKKVEEYSQCYNKDPLCGIITKKKQSVPGHVSASIFWNFCLELFNDVTSPKITSGMKINVYYLNRVQLGIFKSIAIPVDIEHIPDWFTENYMIDKKAQIDRLIDGPLENIMTAIGKDVPSKQGSFVENALEF